MKKVSEERLYMKNWKKRMLQAAMILCMAVLTACGKDGDGTKVVFTTGFGKSDVFRIADEVCKKEELMVYLTTTQNQYEEVYGAEIWDTEHDGVTLEENVKETVLAKIAQIKTMYLMALDRELTLTEQEITQAENAAGEYFTSLNEKEVELLGVTPDTIRSLYEEYALAEKVYETIIRDINPEISDDEARIITVQHILIKTGTTDNEGNRVLDSETERAEAYAKAAEVQTLAVEGAKAFEELAAQYSEDDTITYSFGKGEMDPAFEDVAFQLETNAISDIVESEAGYHIIKCISTFNIEQTDANKVKILEQRRQNAFGQEYDAYVKTLTKQLNEELWSQITLIHDSQVTTSDFFDVYSRFFEENQ